MKPGEIWLIAYHTNSGGQKIRPVMVLSALPGSYQNVLLCGISTQLARAVGEWDELVKKADNDFRESGLERDSAICLSYLLAVDAGEIDARKIGQVEKARVVRLKRRLAAQLEA